MGVLEFLDGRIVSPGAETSRDYVAGTVDCRIFMLVLGGEWPGAVRGIVALTIVFHDEVFVKTPWRLGVVLAHHAGLVGDISALVTIAIGGGEPDSDPTAAQTTGVSACVAWVVFIA